MNYQQVNQRKILKWVFMVLSEHHERMGLKALAWDGPSGVPVGGRIGFFFHTALDPAQRFGAYAQPLGHGLDMGMYQSYIGVWGGTQVYPGQETRELRTVDVLPKIKAELDVQDHYHKLTGTCKFPYQQEDPAWPGQAAVYLYGWNVFGLWQAQRKATAVYYSLSMFPWDYAKPEWLGEAEAGLARVSDPKDILVLISEDWKPQVFWDMNGTVSRMDSQALDLRLCYAQGVSPQAAVKKVDVLLSGLELLPHGLYE